MVFRTLEKALHVITEAAEPGQDKKPGFKTGVPVPIGIALGLFVEIPSLIISDPADMFVWQGSRVNTSFISMLPATLAWVSSETNYAIH